MLRHAVFAELCLPFRLRAAHARGPLYPPLHTQKSESRPRRPLVIFLGVGGVPHQLDGGGRVRVLYLMPTRKGSIHTSTYGLAMHFGVQK